MLAPAQEADLPVLLEVFHSNPEYLQWTEGGEYDPDQFLKAGTVAGAVRAAIETPRDAHPTEVILRPIAR